METKEKRTKAVVSVLVLAGLLGVWTLTTAGDLEPSGPPGPTMKTLDEVEPKIPIHASDLPLTITEPNSYYFVEDIDFDSNDVDAITVGCSDVTIDLMGYTLEGPGSGYTSGIRMSARINVEIRNGTIRNFGYPAIYESTTNGSSHRVINMRLVSNMYGVYLGGSGNLVKDCTVAKNGSMGIYTGWGSTLTGNICYDNGSYGIEAGSGSTVTGNTCYENTSYGIYVGDYCLIDQNTAYNNGTNMHTGTGCQVGLNVAP